jgi:nitrogen regulatory protein PII
MRRERFLSKMKRVEIVVEAQQLDALVMIVQKHATGYTLVPGVTGLGEHGLREAGMVVIVTVVTEEHLDSILAAILPSLNARANILLVSDVMVLRPEHFIPEVRAATQRGKA